MEKLHSEAVDNLFKAILSLKDLDECYRFFEDACTVKEILDVAQRFAVASLLNQGKNYAYISAQTGASAATISRVNKSVSYGKDGYALVLNRMAEENGKR